MNNESKFDTRTLERLLRERTLSRDEVDSMLAALPDSASEADSSSVQFVHRTGVRVHFGVSQDDER